jgi:hypothetical protein
VINEGFLCEATGSLVVVRLLRSPTERVLEECQICMLEAMRDSGSKAVLYDLTEMEPAPINVLLYQRVLNEHLESLQIKRAIVVPNARSPTSPASPSAAANTGSSTTTCRAPRTTCATPALHQRRLERAGDRGTAAARAPPCPPRRRRPARQRPGDRLRASPAAGSTAGFLFVGAIMLLVAGIAKVFLP